MCLCAAVVFILAYVNEARITSYTSTRQDVARLHLWNSVLDSCCFLMSPNVKHVFGGPRSGEPDPSVFVMYAFLIACMR